MKEIAAGFITLTEVTEDGDHAAYNEWHQLDHLPEQLRIPGVVFGQRWVATPACLEAAAPASHPLAAFHYLTLYLMLDPLEKTLEDFAALRTQLTDLGRFYPHRRTALSGAWMFLEALAAPRALIAADAIPYRPHRGIYVIVEELDGGAAGDAHLRRTHTTLLPELVDLPGVTGAWRFGRRLGGFGSTAEADLRTRITLLFLERDPLEVAGAVGARIGTSEEDGVRLRFCGPLLTIRPWEWDWFQPAQDRSSRGRSARRHDMEITWASSAKSTDAGPLR